MSNSKMRKRRSRHGTSLLEVIGALVCSTIVLVPTAVALSDANQWTGRIEAKHQLRLCCESLLEANDQDLLQNFRSNTFSGNFGTRGYPELKYTLHATDRDASGIPNRLMTSYIDAYHDVNGNSVRDAGEPMYQSFSQIARRK